MFTLKVRNVSCPDIIIGPVTPCDVSGRMTRQPAMAQPGGNRSPRPALTVAAQVAIGPPPGAVRKFFLLLASVSGVVNVYLILVNRERNLYVLLVSEIMALLASELPGGRGGPG